MGVRSDVAALIRVEVGVPVYSSLFDGMAVPSVVVWPDSTFLERDEQTFRGLVWNLVVTILVGRASLDGIFDATEKILLETIGAPLGAVGASWRDAGNYRTEQIAGVDYVAVDLYLNVHTKREE
jgi:hypothetical protein